MITPDQVEYQEREYAAAQNTAAQPPAAPASYKSTRAIFSALLLLIPAILSSTTGQLFLKMGMDQVGNFAFTPEGILAALPQIALNPFIWIGMLGFLGGTVFWLGVLSRAPLSLAYPILALSYFVVVIEAWLFLGEQVTWLRLVGVGVIVVGVIIVGLSESRAHTAK